MNANKIVDNLVISCVVERIVQSASFKIPEKIKDNYKISGDLSNVKNWKAKVLLANSGGKVGEWDNVGYVLVSLDSNLLIPVARADEHQMGYDLLWHLINKDLIPNENYMPFYTLSKDYFYKDKIKQYLKLYKKVLNYGMNPDYEVQDYSYDSNYSTSLKEFVDNKGEQVDYSKSEKMPPKGKKIIDYLEKVAKGYKKLVTKSVARDKEIENLFNYALDNLVVIFDYNLEKFAGYNTDDIEKALVKAESTLDYNKLGEIFFSHNGLKNKLHIALKKKSDKELKERGIFQLFGSRERGIKELNRLSNI